ncbi:MAG: cation transporter [Methylohalobius sp.]
MLTRQVILRYRTHGHVRFALPWVLCQPEIASRLIAEVQTIDGVYRVSLSGNKLSIRYQEAFCSFAELARALHAIVTQLEQSGNLPQVALRESPLARLKQSTPVRWLRAKFQEVRETLAAFGILLRRGVKSGSKLVHDPKALAFEFANDVLVLYLIRIHWHRIVNEWIPHPIKYRYEWAAVFYLTYLLVRSRLPK